MAVQSQNTDPPADPSATSDPTTNGDAPSPLAAGTYGTLSKDSEPLVMTKSDGAAGNETGSGKPDSDESPVTVAPRVLSPDLLRGLLTVLMALDHNVAVLKSWPHGQGGESESGSLPVTAWTRPLGYISRTLTHLCGPGFIFLLGLGVMYFGRSRSRIGWSVRRMLGHFVFRALVLTGITVLMGVAFTGGRFWFFNLVLWALAMDYVIAGLLWLGINKTEPGLASVLENVLPGEGNGENGEDGGDESRPLLPAAKGAVPADGKTRALVISWHIHNLGLLLLAGVTIWWNIWLSPTHGHCTLEARAPLFASSGGFLNTFLRMWFFQVVAHRIISTFPPLAWLSFAILGLLYGRLILARNASPKLITFSSSLLFGLLFVATRLFQFGNLSQDCIQIGGARPPDSGGNQYLASPQAFFYVTKYPPDVGFFAYTMAGNLLLLGLFDCLPARLAARRLAVLLAFGGSALFFYIVHMLVLFSVGNLVVSWFGHPLGEKDILTGEPAYGVENLWVFFGLLAFMIAVLYPMCRWYSAFKVTRKSSSIWRFF
ncbi:hypothetical protein F4778DRAFT_55143 [Xylariomycetidae sp. FL2044]|nr:hypothetical protein F4778DRAFT_55143 [Xylariomycetidae sp. FL2044]